MAIKINDYIGTFSKIENLTSHTKLFTINLNNEIDFKSGQFVNLSFELNGEIYRKPYSICSSPSNKNQIQLCINLVKDGRVTPKLFEKKENEQVTIKGPLGLFTLNKEDEKSKLVFICTGTGIAPLRSMIKSVFEDLESQIDENNKDDETVILNKEILLIFGTRFEQDILFQKEFEDLEEKFANFKYIKIISKPTEKWEGRVGHVQENFDNIDSLNSKIYMCGVPKMIESSKEKLIEMGIDEKDIHFEKYV